MLLTSKTLHIFKYNFYQNIKTLLSLLQNKLFKFVVA